MLKNGEIMKEKRIDKFQALRGICILAVILIHCQNYNLFDGSVSSYLYFFGRNVISFPVSVFMFISGYFVNPDRFIENRGGTAREYITKRAQRLLLPYLFWSVIYMMISALFQNKELSIKYVISCLFLGKAATPFYYIIVLTYFTFMTPWLAKRVDNKQMMIAVTSVALGIMVCGYILQFLGIQAFSLMKYSPIWIAFYYWGMTSRKAGILNGNFKGNSIYFVLLVMYILELLETLILIRLEVEVIAYSQMRITSYLFAAAFLVAYLQKQKALKLDNVLTAIGDESYGIFYVHFLIISIVRLITNNSLSYPIGTIIEFICALIFSIIIVKVVRSIGNKTLRLLTGI